MICLGWGGAPTKRYHKTRPHSVAGFAGIYKIAAHTEYAIGWNPPAEFPSGGSGCSGFLRELGWRIPNVPGVPDVPNVSDVPDVTDPTDLGDLGDPGDPGDLGDLAGLLGVVKLAVLADRVLSLGDLDGVPT